MLRELALVSTDTDSNPMGNQVHKDSAVMFVWVLYDIFWTIFFFLGNQVQNQQKNIQGNAYDMKTSLYVKFSNLIFQAL